jgi:hypothetical protein
MKSLCVELLRPDISTLMSAVGPCIFCAKPPAHAEGWSSIELAAAIQFTELLLSLDRESLMFDTTSEKFPREVLCKSIIPDWV